MKPKRSSDLNPIIVYYSAITTQYLLYILYIYLFINQFKIFLNDEIRKNVTK